MLTVLMDLALLAEHLAALRDTQNRHHQADAARTVATGLRSAVAAAGRLGSPPTVTALDPNAAPLRPDADAQLLEASTRDSHGRASGR
jgi:hypothetical protein